MNYYDYPMREIKILHKSPLLKWKLSCNYTIFNNYLKECIHHILKQQTKININNPAYRKNLHAHNIKGYFCGGWNNTEILTYRYKIFIPHKIQRYIFNWYHTYLLHTRLDRMEAMICQNLFWTVIRNAIQKEVNNCDKLQL